MLMKLIDETGNKYFHWTVLRKATKEVNGRKGGAYWLCQCDCNKKTKKIICGSSLRKGESKSCGCASFVNTRITLQKKLNKRKEELVGLINTNYQGSIMKIIEYNNATNVVVQFQDKYRALKITDLKAFNNGSVKNPYFPEVYGVGMIGDKYPAYKDAEVKEYKMLEFTYSKML